MWTNIANFIIRFRLPLTVTIALITVVMGFYASKVEMSYDFARTVPLDDPEMVFLTKFKQQFGEDGNVVAVGLKDSTIYNANNFEKFRLLSEKIKSIEGVNSVLCLPTIKIIRKDTANARFKLEDLFPKRLLDQVELDSLLGIFRNQKFYMGQLVNEGNGATMMIVSINKDFINSSKRVDITNGLVEAGSEFTNNTQIELRYAGLPFVRSVVAVQVRKEMQLFLALSAVVTGLIMFLFFRSSRAVLFSMIVIGIVVVWVLGTLALFGYKITLLSGLIPPVIVTIGITNAIYLLNKYHLEFAKHNDKALAISTVVKKMGLATFLTNLTVAIGFLTLLSTDILILREFGIVAGINIMVLFVVSLIMLPGIFSWLPEPEAKHLRHLNFKILGKFVRATDLTVHRHRVIIYSVSIALAVISAFGMQRLQSISFIVDDIPEESQDRKSVV